MARAESGLTLRLLRLGAPIAVGRLGVVAMGITDAIVVGQLAPRELAHQALGWVINGPALLGGIGLLLGVQILAARAVGAGAPAAAGVFWRRGLVIALAAGALVCALVWTLDARLLTAFGTPAELAARGAAVAGVLAFSIPLHLAFMASAKFLEALERPLPGAVAMWVANGLNLLLNLALVPAEGAVGSAWATVLSRLFLALALGAYVLWSPSLRPYRGGAAAPGGGYGALLAIGGAAALSALVEAAAFAAMSVIAARAGGAVAVSTWAIATGGLVTLVFLLAQGLATAGTVLVSEAVGRGETRLAARVGWTAVGLTVAAMAACALASLAFARPLAAAFTAEPAVQASLVATMGLIGLLMLADGGQGTADAVLRARGINWFPTAIRIGAFVLVAPPLAAWLAHRGVAGVFEAILVASYGAFLLMLARLVARDRRRGATRV